MYKQTRWAKQLIDLQNEQGAWGYFHTLHEPEKNPFTTEQALRRLAILGYTIEDPPIQKAVSYMSNCLAGRNSIPDRPEKLHNWLIFTDLMLAAWIRKFTSHCQKANDIAATWATVISSAFTGNDYDHQRYIEAYERAFRITPKGGRLVDFVNFYHVSLVAGALDPAVESAVVDYVLQHGAGMYYVYPRPLCVPPGSFASKQASWYLAAMEILAGYRSNIRKLQFVTEWLLANGSEDGTWDMGSNVNDKVYFPLSDSWRKKSDRIKDCTCRVNNLLTALGAASG